MQPVMHLYTTDPNENPAGWLQEQFDCYIFSKDLQPIAGVVALTRWRHPEHNTHVFAMNGKKLPGWIEEGLHGYVHTEQQHDTVPIYHWFNPGTGDHLYTLDKNGELGPTSGYNKTSEIFYSFSTARTNAVKMNRWVIGPIPDAPFCVVLSKNSSSGGRQIVRKIDVEAPNYQAAVAMGPDLLKRYNKGAIDEYKASTPIQVNHGKC